MCYRGEHGAVQCGFWPKPYQKPQFVVFLFFYFLQFQTKIKSNYLFQHQINSVKKRYKMEPHKRRRVKCSSNKTCLLKGVDKLKEELGLLIYVMIRALFIDSLLLQCFSHQRCGMPSYFHIFTFPYSLYTTDFLYTNINFNYHTSYIINVLHNTHHICYI